MQFASLHPGWHSHTPGTEQDPVVTLQPLLQVAKLKMVERLNPPRLLANVFGMRHRSSRLDRCCTDLLASCQYKYIRSGAYSIREDTQACMGLRKIIELESKIKLKFKEVGPLQSVLLRM